MPGIANTSLTLTTVNEDVQIRVKFTARFSEFERNLANLGMQYNARVAAIGVDPAGGTTGANLANLPGQTFNVTQGSGFQDLTYDETVTRTRASLQEDPGADADEIRARIRLSATGLPAALTERFTDQEVLLG